MFLAVDVYAIGGGLDDGLGVRGSPTSDNGGLTVSAGDDLIMGTICLDEDSPLPLGTSSCDDDDDDERNVRLLWSL